MRTCYSSEWFLFEDDLVTTTAGRYYFSPPKTPFYSGSHCFGSRTWYDGNWKHNQGLGESITAKHGYDEGELPTVIPLSVRVGEASCFESGEVAGGDVDPSTLINGFPLQCFVLPPPPVLDFLSIASVFTCTVQRLFSRIIDWLYQGEDARIQETLLDFFGAGPDITIHPAAGNFPAVCTLISTAGSIAIVNGTQNFQQLALQAAESLQAPTDNGDFSTLPLWFNAANYIHAILVDDGADATKPCTFAGHSYGGAAVSILAAIYHKARPLRDVTVCTFGCPKIGDRRLQQILSELSCCHIVNDNDIVTVIPPNTTQIAPYVPLIAQVVFRNWLLWQRPGVHVRLTPAGVSSVADADFPAYATFVPILQNLLAGQLVPQVQSHSIDEYYRRITLQCPDVEWPIDGFVVDDLNGVGDFRLLASGGDKAGGNSAFRPGRGWKMSGGDKAGGAAKFGRGWNLAAAGGDKAGGSAGFIHSRDLAAAGGDKAGGSAGFIHSRDLAAAGGDKAGGSAGFIHSRHLAAAGGDKAGGSAGFIHSRHLAAAGGDKAGGSATIAHGTGSPHPGATCATAGLLSPGQSGTSTLTGFSNNDWWYFPVTSGTHYTITMTINSGTFSGESNTEGSCAFSTLLPSCAPPITPSVSFTAAANDLCLMHVSPPFSGSLNYTLAVTSP